MHFLTLRFKGPLMALQGPRIDGEPQSLPIPTVSLVTGLIGAALGLSRGEAHALQALQDAMTLAIVVHKPGVEITDYQIADLSKAHLMGPMWSSGTSTVEREGSTTTGTRQQWRPYLADADMTVVMALDTAAPFKLYEINSALREPVRPLFLGRTSCPPDTALVGDAVEAECLIDAVNAVAATRSASVIYLPAKATGPEWGDLPVSIPGRRDWLTDRHSGADLFVCRQPAQAGGG